MADAEARLRAEVARLKKKYQAEIAELEMTVDNLNRANIEAQKTIKKQSEQLKVKPFCQIEYSTTTLFSFLVAIYQKILYQLNLLIIVLRKN